MVVIIGGGHWRWSLVVVIGGGHWYAMIDDIPNTQPAAAPAITDIMKPAKSSEPQQLTTEKERNAIALSNMLSTDEIKSILAIAKAQREAQKGAAGKDPRLHRQRGCCR